MKKILIVDDDNELRLSLGEILINNGFSPALASSGRLAINLFTQERPDAVLLDLNMPDMNGIEAAIHIRGFLPGCKILLFSGQAATADLLENARERGYEFQILAKPVHPQDLLAKLRE